jgi:hypothetical protein
MRQTKAFFDKQLEGLLYMRSFLRNFFLFMAIILFTSSFTGTVQAQETVTIQDNKPYIDFPNRITFNADIKAGKPPKSVVLEYGVEQLTCGNVIARTFPEFQGTTFSVSWTWEMLQTGSLPPGAQVWWRWHVTAEDGSQTTSPRKILTWLDNIHPWQSIDQQGVRLNWYDGSSTFARKLHKTAIDTLNRLQLEAGLTVDAPINIYIYSNPDDMREAILYEPNWTGGMAFPEQNIVIIGIAPQNLEWGNNTIKHELTHVLVGHDTFSCLGSVPTWLNEGLAVFSEGSIEESSQQSFEKAVSNDNLIPLRALSGGFSEESDKADLSYSESYSVVNFMLETYGRPKMQSLLESLRDGETIDSSLKRIYGFNTEELEDAWRKAIGARPLPRVGAAGPTLLPTFIPTIRPVSGIPLVNATPVPVLTTTSTPTLTPQLETIADPTFSSRTATFFSGTTLIVIAAICLLTVGIFIGVIITLVVRKRGS